MRPCSLNERRVRMCNWRCRGLGRPKRVPGMLICGSEGWGVEYWFPSDRWVELASATSDDDDPPECIGRVRSECSPGRNKILTVCSTTLLRCPSAKTAQER